MRGNRPDKTGLSFPKTKISPSRKRKKEGLDLPFSGDPAGYVELSLNVVAFA